MNQNNEENEMSETETTGTQGTTGMVTHLPLPWCVEYFHHAIEAADGTIVTKIWGPKEHYEEDVANAELICEAVNSHEKLKAENAKLQGVVRSLMRELEPFCDGGSRRDEVMDAAREALGEKKEPKKVFVHAVVRYPEDAEVNGQDEDNDNPKMPLLAFEGMEYGMKKWVWHIAIDAKSGKIDDWPEGVEAKTWYKVCDRCGVNIEGVPPYEDYVPDFLSIDGEGYGDYIYLTIGGDGTIKGWDEKRVWEWVREHKKSLREDG